MGAADLGGKGRFFEAGYAAGQSPAEPGWSVGGKAINVKTRPFGPALSAGLLLVMGFLSATTVPPANAAASKDVGFGKDNAKLEVVASTGTGAPPATSPGAAVAQDPTRPRRVEIGGNMIDLDASDGVRALAIKNEMAKVRLHGVDMEVVLNSRGFVSRDKKFIARVDSFSGDEITYKETLSLYDASGRRLFERIDTEAEEGAGVDWLVEECRVMSGGKHLWVRYSFDPFKRNPLMDKAEMLDQQGKAILSYSGRAEVWPSRTDKFALIIEPLTWDQNGISDSEKVLLFEFNGSTVPLFDTASGFRLARGVFSENGQCFLAKRKPHETGAYSPLGEKLVETDVMIFRGASVWARYRVQAGKDFYPFLSRTCKYLVLQSSSIAQKDSNGVWTGTDILAVYRNPAGELIDSGLDRNHERIWPYIKETTTKK